MIGNAKAGKKRGSCWKKCQKRIRIKNRKKRDHWRKFFTASKRQNKIEIEINLLKNFKIKNIKARHFRLVTSVLKD